MMIKYPWRGREAFHIFLDFENAEVITTLSVFQRQKRQFEALLVVHPSLQKCIGTPFSLVKGGCRTKKNKEAIQPANPLAANDDKIMALKRITRSFHVTGLNGSRMDLQVFQDGKQDEDVTLTSSYPVYRHLLKTNHRTDAFSFIREINKNK
ncbi:hypothetical protein CDAR_600791 [Caerostris darwini]|uniref:Uncharacterized protein n=1 Tax=Caerostris darwini TaxID=1538125 RepID=A0AAV4TWJ5_9ARAC|nr:hypothetical protein CDAR_600791 [Caerostris darwini]